tara:strand:+ start:8320 stop:8538 length:219 start_codon:yes stop_codon:yes gene_type:complete
LEFSPNKVVNAVKKVGFALASQNFNQLFLAGYNDVEAIGFLFIKRNSLFYGVRMHYLILLALRVDLRNSFFN